MQDPLAAVRACADGALTTPGRGGAPAAPALAPAPARTLGDRLALAAADIKLSHSVFAMPFALLGAFLARPTGAPWSQFAVQGGLIVGCMFFARSWAMLVNRIADSGFDAGNPRTARRAVASGRLARRDAIAMAVACAASFCTLAALFGVLFGNWWPAGLCLPVLGWLALYSFAKRFTALCHVLLGTALAISPMAACLAVQPEVALSPVVLLLAGFVTLWVAGFDVLYALQDTDFDRRTGLSSIPAKLGPAGAAWVSRGMHVGAAACLALAWRAEGRFGVLFGVAVGLAAVLLIVEHAVVIRRGLAGLPMAFFTVNGALSLLVGALGIADLLA
ncbi:MAG: putative 4-hydroxybenzoate polyprenyltransferase [Planctomycetaceae bacterium]|nr:4-hydroxybenzoate octaprenyltransferase [Phycisphaerales bacterium]MCE2654150.1 putative 4-hydroxybenzoate polyprenyltransferase [Planctomycetaceae bacterium]